MHSLEPTNWRDAFFRACSSLYPVDMPKDDRLNEILGLLHDNAKRLVLIEERLTEAESSGLDMRTAFDHSMQFFESRLGAIDMKLDSIVAPKLQSDGESTTKVSVLKGLFEKTTKKSERQAIDSQSQATETDCTRVHCETMTELAEVNDCFSQTVLMQVAHTQSQTFTATSEAASMQTEAMSKTALSQTDAHSPLMATKSCETDIGDCLPTTHASHVVNGIESQFARVCALVTDCELVRSGENRLPPFVGEFFAELIEPEQDIWSMDSSDPKLPHISARMACTVFNDSLNQSGIATRVPRLVTCLNQIAVLLTERQLYEVVKGYFAYLPAEFTRFLYHGGALEYLKSIDIDVNESHDHRSPRWNWSKGQWKSWNWSGR